MIAGVPGQMALTLLTPPIRGVVPLYNRRKKILLMSTTYEWRGDPPYLDTLMWIMWHADVGPEATKLLLGVDLLTTCRQLASHQQVDVHPLQAYRFQITFTLPIPSGGPGVLSLFFLSYCSLRSSFLVLIQSCLCIHASKTQTITYWDHRN